MMQSLNDEFFSLPLDDEFKWNHEASKMLLSVGYHSSSTFKEFLIVGFPGKISQESFMSKTTPHPAA